MTESFAASNLFARYQDLLRGGTISHVWRGHGSALFLEIGALSPTVLRDGSPGNPVGDYSIMIEWSWRIEDGRTVLCGSWSDESEWQVHFDGLVGRDIADLQTFGQLPEIAVGLTGGLSLLSFQTSGGQPAWTIFDRGARRHICVEDGEMRERAA